MGRPWLGRTSFEGIENITTGSGDDTPVGDANANVLTGGAGDDTLTGGAGDDVSGSTVLRDYRLT